MYHFLITEITEYGKTGNCVAGFLFNKQNGITQPIGRKRLYLISETSGRSIYPSSEKFQRGVLTFSVFQNGILTNDFSVENELYPREQRKEDISIDYDSIVNIKILSEEDYRPFFRNIEIPKFDFSKYFPKFIVRKSKKIFTQKRLNIRNCDSLFYFEFSKSDISFTKDLEGDSYLNFNYNDQELRIKIISAQNDFTYYKKQFSNNSSKIIACIGISQYFDCDDNPENSGYYLLCNEIYFM